MSDTQDVNDQAEAQDADAVDHADGHEQDSQPTGFDALPPETQAEIKRLRRENASYRNKVKAAEDAEKTELQRLADAKGELEQKYADLESKYRSTIVESAFIKAATDEKARTPRTLFRAYKSELEFDDDGNVTNLAAVIEKARAEEPEAFMPTGGTADGGKTGPITSDNGMNNLFRDLARTTN